MLIKISNNLKFEKLENRLRKYERRHSTFPSVLLYTSVSIAAYGLL